MIYNTLILMIFLSILPWNNARAEKTQAPRQDQSETQRSPQAKSKPTSKMDDKQTKVFERAISFLDVAPAWPEGQAAPYTHSLDASLFKEYLQEITSLKKAYKLEKSDISQIEYISKKTDQNNKKFLSAINKWSANQIKQLAKPALKAEQKKLPSLKIAKQIYSELYSNDVTRIASVDKYDKRGDIGFCFARATFVHFLALKHQINPRYIAKIFGLGQLSVDKKLWKFHVATALFTKDKGWVIIDNLFKEPQPMAKWMEKVRLFSIKKKKSQTRFYLTDPRKFQPSHPKYELSQFTIPELAPYNYAMLSSIMK